ncbi:MAG: FGGY-family carbohydrate kinase [Firmicutes bacterium]|nr:FGGY-family carbohydrate kinase [Bacillota bacterium]MBR0441370.1 FGGY-family carbohydrate kinase [Bacillota bacterium]
MTGYLMGVDVGTQETKGVIIDTEGGVICTAAVPHGTENPRPRFFEHDAEKVWLSDVCTVTRSLLEKSGIDPAGVLGLGLSTIGTCLVPVDRDLKPLRKAILYGIDARAEDEIRWMTDYYSPEFIDEHFGRPICSDDVAAKILWIKNKEPEVYKRTYKFLTGTSFLVARLTGSFALDRFLGAVSFRPLYNADGTIREELCGPYCRPDQLPEGKVVTDMAGRLSSVGAALTGLCEGTPVMTGSGDSGSEAISTGVLDPGDTMIQLGSTVYMYCCTDRPLKNEKVHSGGFLIPGRYSLSAGTNNCGTATKWYRDNFFEDLKAEEAKGGENAYSAMMRGLEKIAPGSDGLITLPYFAGERSPISDPQAKGMILGLTLNHTKAHIYRSALEGIAFGIAQNLACFKEAGVESLRLLAVGGGTKNPLWLQMISDITGEELNVMAVTMGACYGDALMAGITTGVYEDFPSLKKIIKPAKTYRPDMQAHEAYRPFMEIFEEAYEANKGLMHRL